MAGFLGGVFSNNMGGAASTGTQMSATDYESLALTLSPNTRSSLPSTDVAMSLMENFESLSLAGSSDEHCRHCNKAVQNATVEIVHADVEKSMSEQPFVYQGCTYCSLDCFFDDHSKEPGLCMWIDSLFSAAVKIRQAQISGAGSTKQQHK